MLPSSSPNFFLPLPCESGVLFQVSKEFVELDSKKDRQW